MGAQIAIRGQQRDGDGQNWERNDDQDVSTQGRPVNTGIFIIGMRGTHLQNGGEEVHAGQQGTQTGNLQTPDPVIDPDAGLYSLPDSGGYASQPV